MNTYIPYFFKGRDDLMLKHNHGSLFFSNYNVVIGLLSFLIVSLFALVTSSISVFVSFIFFGFTGVAISALHARLCIKIFSIVFSFASIFSIILYYVFLVQYGIPYGGGGSDSLAYEQDAAIIAQSNLFYNADDIGLAIDRPYHNSKGYIYFVSLLMRIGYYLGGFHTMIPRLFNAFLLGICSVLVYAISRKINLSERQSLNASLITGLFPIMLYVADQTLRDIPILVIMLYSVYLTTIFIKTGAIYKHLFLIILFVPIFLFIMELRMLSVINIAIVLGVALFIKIFSIRYFSNKHIIISIILAFFTYKLIKTSDFSLFIDLIKKLDSSGSDLAEGVDRAGEGGLSLILFNLPIPFNYIGSLFYSFITPLPILYTKDWDWNFLSLGTIYQFLCFPFVFLGIKESYRSSLMLPILFMFLISFLGYVFGSFTFRHITYFVPYAAIYGVIGYEKYKKLRWTIWLFLLFVLFFLLIAYYTIKL